MNWGRGSSLRKAVDLELVLLRYVVRINENIFSSSFVEVCSIFDELPLLAVHSFKTKPQSGLEAGVQLLCWICLQPQMD